MVDLGDAQKIDDKINSTMELVNDLPSHIALLKSYTQTTNAALAELYDLILRPLSGFLSIYSGLIVSPDGEINKVPLAALRTPEGQYLIERHTISYVASGRDLLRRSTGGPAGADLFLVADPDFDDARAFETSSVSGGSITFDRLPGTAVEAQVIPPLVSGGQKTVISRRQATEAAVKSATAPRVLHLATHGFFLEDVQLPVADLGTISSLIGDGQERGLGGVRELSPATVIDLPADTRLSSMARSGLAFAGANHATAAVFGDDGILTALEVAGMNLHGTDLVVLSACQTAVGEVSVGEGVFGLRRAFVLAGAQNLVMSLWLVLDDVTVAQMEEFYRAFGANESPAEALRQAQLKTINELRASTQAHPGIGEPLAPVKVWAPFIVQQSGP